jgi:hypothetical protein
MNTQSKVLKWSVIIGIIIVLNLFFNYAISLVYKQPEFNNFCPMEQVVTVPETQQACVAKGGQWTTNPSFAKPIPAGMNQPAGYCDLQFSCRQAYDTARQSYDRNIFIVLVVLGALSVLAGNLLGRNEVISQGLALGGVLSFVIASMRYWSAANDLIRVIILAIALGILFWIAWKKFNERIQS